MADAPRSSLLDSRGVRLALIACSPVMFLIVLAGLAVFISMVRGKTSLEMGIGLMFVAILGGAVTAVPPILKIVDGWTKQDEAKIAASAPAAAPNPGTTIAIGENATATAAPSPASKDPSQ
jgi:hypothetical protein